MPYTHRADRRDAKGQMAHTETHFVVYVNAKSDTPSQDLHCRDSRAFVFDNLNTYLATNHLTFGWVQATGVSYCMAQESI